MSDETHECCDWDQIPTTDLCGIVSWQQSVGTFHAEVFGKHDRCRCYYRGIFLHGLSLNPLSCKIWGRPGLETLAIKKHCMSYSFSLSFKFALPIWIGIKYVGQKRKSSVMSVRNKTKKWTVFATHDGYGIFFWERIDLLLKENSEFFL